MPNYNELIKRSVFIGGADGTKAKAVFIRSEIEAKPKMKDTIKNLYSNERE